MGRGRRIVSNTIEIGTCDICGNTNIQVSRQYYHYRIQCECCVGSHFEIVRYCKNCKPKPPIKINVMMDPIEKIEHE